MLTIFLLIIAFDFFNCNCLEMMLNLCIGAVNYRYYPGTCG